jgi:nucleotide-binding universal stress UspA family protein
VPGQLEGRQPAGLRILLAHDLSAASDVAASLLAAGPWPTGTTIRVVTSPAGIGPPLSSFASLREVRAHAAEVRGMIAHAHERLATVLGAAGVAVETRTVHGKAQRAILLEAERLAADLIVVGARGQGSLAATLLGSVSRAVVEDAAASVLVVRRAALDRVLLSADGSPAARAATSVIADWPAFAASRVLVVAVGPGAPRYPRSVLDPETWRSAFRESITASSDQACDHADTAATTLSSSGREVEVEVRLGDTAAEVSAAAREWPADLVVLGTGGRALLERLVMGSAPRRILDGVDASVLVVRVRDETDLSG